MLALEVVSGAAGPPTSPRSSSTRSTPGSAEAALGVGSRLARLAEHAQVVVVTHLAQVAAYADRHHVVRKASDGHITSSGVHPVDGEERLRELARMMAGVDATPRSTTLASWWRRPPHAAWAPQHPDGCMGGLPGCP